MTSWFLGDFNKKTSTEELENFLDFLFYLRNSPEKLMAVVFGNIIIFLSAALVFLAKVKPKKQRYAIHSRGNKTLAYKSVFI